jgi:hypothetical protein
VIIFDSEAELTQIIRQYKPGYVVRGRPHSKPSPELAADLATWGGKFHYFEGPHESTSDIIRRCAEAYRGDR